MQKIDTLHPETKIFEIESEEELQKIVFPLAAGERVFFYGDLGAGKTTFIRALLHEHFHNHNLIVRSPTYTYFQQYGSNVYHFDLYRVEEVDNLFLIGAHDILGDEENIALIEWPEILGDSVVPTRKVHISLLSNGRRNIRIETFHSPLHRAHM